MSFLALPWLLPRVLGVVRDDLLYLGPTIEEKTTYLTIDDAPTEATAQLIEVLARHRVPATFFVMTGRVSSPGQIAAITNAGHAVGHHMISSRACAEMTDEEFIRDFDLADALLKAHAAPFLFRPASGFGRRTQTAYARSRGYVPVLGTLFPMDHWIENPTLAAWLVRWLSCDGGIIILHDGARRGVTTAEVLDKVIPALRERGFTFRRLDDAVRLRGGTNRHP